MQKLNYQLKQHILASCLDGSTPLLVSSIGYINTEGRAFDSKETCLFVHLLGQITQLIVAGAYEITLASMTYVHYLR